VLLGAQDGPGSRNSDPADEGLRGNLEMFHRVTADKSACPAKTSLTVDGKHALIPLTQLNEFV